MSDRWIMGICNATFNDDLMVYLKKRFRRFRHKTGRAKVELEVKKRMVPMVGISAQSIQEKRDLKVQEGTCMWLYFKKLHVIFMRIKYIMMQVKDTRL